MMTHEDGDFENIRKHFMERLGERADKAERDGTGKVTFGSAGEEVLGQWKINDVHVRQLPADEQGILRISIGGGNHLPVPLNYLTFRGNRGHCIDLLRKALKALESDPQ